MTDEAAATKQTKGKGKKGGPSATPSLRDCACCGAPEGSIPGIKSHNACSRCKMTFYCGTKCQKEHWKKGGHKERCVAPEARSVAATATASASASASAEEDCCAICLGALSESPTTALSCSHVYHTACVAQLRSFDVQQTCPTCRSKTRTMGPQERYEDAMFKFQVLRRRYSGGWELSAEQLRKPWPKLRGADKAEMASILGTLKAVADMGQPHAIGMIGQLYRDGHGVPQDFSKALHFTRRCAEQAGWGQDPVSVRIKAQAQHNVGRMYETGRGTRVDHAEAVEWFRKSAALGSPDGVNSLGAMIMRGWGVPQDSAEAARLFQKAAKAGHPFAQVNLDSALAKLRLDKKEAALARKASQHRAHIEAFRQQMVQKSVEFEKTGKAYEYVLTMGRRVKLTGVVAKPELNGRTAEVVGEYDHASGRVAVRVEGGGGEGGEVGDGGTGTTLKVKTANLLLVKETAPHAPSSHDELETQGGEEEHEAGEEQEEDIPVDDAAEKKTARMQLHCAIKSGHVMSPMSRATCWGQHVLQQVTNPLVINGKEYDEVHCDVCGSDVPRKGVLWDCRHCNYDLCSDCYRPMEEQEKKQELWQAEQKVATMAYERELGISKK